MPKKLNDNSVNSNSKYFDTGVFVDLIKIDNVVDKSNYPLSPTANKKTIGNKGFEPELCLEITSNDKKIYIFGKFEYREDTISGKTKYVGWKRANNSVWNLLYVLFGDKAEINDDDTIPERLLKEMVGKKFYKLRYCIGMDDKTNKPAFRDFSYFTNGDKEENAEVLFNKFANSDRFNYDYDPIAYENYVYVQKTFNPKNTDIAPPNNESGNNDPLPF